MAYITSDAFCSHVDMSTRYAVIPICQIQALLQRPYCCWRVTVSAVPILCWIIQPKARIVFWFAGKPQFLTAFADCPACFLTRIAINIRPHIDRPKVRVYKYLRVPISSPFRMFCPSLWIRMTTRAILCTLPGVIYIVFFKLIKDHVVYAVAVTGNCFDVISRRPNGNVISHGAPWQHQFVILNGNNIWSP